jgi:amidase
MMKQPWFTGDATALAQAIAQGEFSAVQAMEHTLADVAVMNPALNAVCLLRADLGLETAATLDAELSYCDTPRQRQQLMQRRPFFGVPLLIKDVGPATAHPQFPSRMGSRVFGLQGAQWPAMGTLTQRYIDAGFVVFGRTTTPEMGISASTEAVAYGGPTRNPWGLAHSAGGSSGGAAAATSAGLVTLAHANDGAGSIRIPASACGLIGLKPSRGLTPCGPLAGESWGGLAIDHVLTRSVRDCAAVLQATMGADPGAPYCAPAQPINTVDALAVPPSPLRIALCNRFFEGDAVHPEVAQAVANFALQLQALGHEVEEASPDFSTLDVVRPMMQVVATGIAMSLQATAAARGRPISPDELEPAVWDALRVGSAISGTDYLQAVNALHTLGRQMAAFHTRFDLLLTPTLAEPPAALGRFAMGNPDFMDYRLGPQGLWRYSPFTPLANATGAASISLPAGLSTKGLPIGAMLSGQLGDDTLLLRMAAQWEAAHPGSVPLAPCG